MEFPDYLSRVKIGSLSLEALFSAVIILVLCLIAGKLLVVSANRILIKSKLENALKGFIKSAVRVVLWILTAIIVAESLGIPGRSLVAAFSVAGLAVSLSVQNTLANLFSGFTILVTKPFSAGDFIETEGSTGTVSSVNLFHTVLKTPDNKIIYIPNGDMTKSSISNCSRESLRRVDLFFRTPFECDAEKVKAALFRAVFDDKRILTDPPPQIVLMSFESSYVKYGLRLWVKSDDYWDVFFGVNESVRELFEHDGINPAYEHINVHIHGD